MTSGIALVISSIPYSDFHIMTLLCWAPFCCLFSPATSHTALVSALTLRFRPSSFGGLPQSPGGRRHSA